MTRKTAVVGLAATVVTVVVLSSLLNHKPPPLPGPRQRSAEALSATKDLSTGSKHFSAGRLGEAEGELDRMVAKYRASDDPDTQDAVAKARLTLGYVSAQRKDFQEARGRFKLAASEYRGTGAADPGFGRMDDQALYQAAVCLQAEGKKDEAVAAYKSFMTERKASPLTAAVRRRLIDLDPANTGQYDRMLQESVTEQDRLAKFQLSRCGPLALAEFLRVTGRPSKGIDELTALCGTTEKGTTMQALRQAFQKLGIAAEGFSLNLGDFKAAKLPFVWLAGDHYILVEAVHGDSLTVCDPLTGRQADTDLQKVDQASFKANVLILK